MGGRGSGCGDDCLHDNEDSQQEGLSQQVGRSHDAF